MTYFLRCWTSKSRSSGCCGMSEWLDRFSKPLESLDERVIGTHLRPHRLFPPLDFDDPFSATEVIGKAQANGRVVLATRNGGLFMRTPTDLPNVLTTPPEDLAENFGRESQAKVAFEEEAVACFNLVICELALLGVVSEPATPAHVSVGKMVDDHAAIVSAVGGRELYPDRTVQPFMELARGNLVGFGQFIESDILMRALLLERATALADMSKYLPTLVAGAYSLFSQRQIGEALADAWFASEQMLDYMWRQYVSSVPGQRRSRLEDTRTYTAAVRTEVLHTAGRLDSATYEALNSARQKRNAFAHRARVDLSAAQVCLDTMKAMIELLCATSVEPPLANTGLNW